MYCKLSFPRRKRNQPSALPPPDTTTAGQTSRPFLLRLHGSSYSSTPHRRQPLTERFPPTQSVTISIVPPHPNEDVCRDRYPHSYIPTSAIGTTQHNTTQHAARSTVGGKTATQKTAADDRCRSSAAILNWKPDHSGSITKSLKNAISSTNAPRSCDTPSPPVCSRRRTAARR